ncbi:SDR family oxidoreductase [Streptomyces sp. NPDC089919]|uniref:SDR family oxidoreductase n=1 Tax=Streptomyces sp. NPDC089919 TaxID=3155188 RepID=UPI003438EB02
MSAQKIALVTGANKGIGLEIARQLAVQGATVVLGARDLERGRRAAEQLAARGVETIPLQLDVTDAESIAAVAKEIEERFGRLDILVNNAGITGGFFGPPSQATPELLKEVYETNVFGVLSVTNAMIPLLRRSEAGRVVNMSSTVGSLALNADLHGEFGGYNMLTYQSSKTAVNAITIAHAKELKDTNIKVNSANPGFTATDMNNHRGHQTVEEGAVIAVRLANLGPDGPTGTNQDDSGTVPW